MAFIKTIPLFTNQVILAGSNGTSGVIDLREVDSTGRYSVNVNQQNGAAATAGSTTYEYLSCASRNGTFATSGTFATRGAGLGAAVLPFDPEVSPFMKVKVNTGTSGAVTLSAELNVQ